METDLINRQSQRNIRTSAEEANRENKQDEVLKVVRDNKCIGAAIDVMLTQFFVF